MSGSRAGIGAGTGEGPGRRLAQAAAVGAVAFLAACDSGGCVSTPIAPCPGETSVTIAAPSTTTILVGETVTLTATVGGGAQQGVTWSVAAGGSFASVSASGVVTGLAAGTATIRATSNVDPTAADQIQITVEELVCDEGPLPIGGTDTGDLDSSDCVAAGYFEDYWTFSLGASTPITVDALSSDFDTYLILETASGTVITGVTRSPLITLAKSCAWNPIAVGCV